MFFVAFGACFPLIFRCETNIQRTAIIIYSCCALMMFAISSLYHRVTWSVTQRATWKKFDHCGIYLMIAGNFTPICLLALSEKSGMTLLITIWIIALLGIIKSFNFTNLPKFLSSLFYLLMGYQVVPYLSEIIHSIGIRNFWLLLLGGILYTIGALVYSLKRPVFNPKVFSYHELFHIFVNLGATFHFIVISSLI